MKAGEKMDRQINKFKSLDIALYLLLAAIAALYLTMSSQLVGLQHPKFFRHNLFNTIGFVSCCVTFVDPKIDNLTT